MEPYNIKVLTFPDLTKQVRVYCKYVESKPHKNPYIHENPFNGDLVRDIRSDLDDAFLHSAEVSLKRSRAKVFNYAKCNSWDWFVTFTFSSEKVNRYDYDECTKILSKWLNNLRRDSPHLSYLVVPERHKDGAYHFHGLFAGVDERLIVWSGKYVIKRVRGSDGKSKFRKTDKKIYTISKYRLGWMTATEIQDRERVISYITKYMTKDLVLGLYGKKRYWASRNLLLPVEETFAMDSWDSFALTEELKESAAYHKQSIVSYGDMTQKVDIFDL